MVHSHRRTIGVVGSLSFTSQRSKNKQTPLNIFEGVFMCRDSTLSEYSIMVLKKALHWMKRLFF